MVIHQRKRTGVHECHKLLVFSFHLFPSFVTDEAGGISARNVLQLYQRYDWCAGIV